MQVQRGDISAVVVGLRTAGIAIAGRLVDDGFRTYLVGESTLPAERVLPRGCRHVIGNALDPSEEIGELFRSATVVVAATDADDTNTLIALSARGAFGAACVVALCIEPDRAATYARFQIPYICPNDLIAAAVSNFVRDHRGDEMTDRPTDARS